jgi:hypothetical protein
MPPDRVLILRTCKRNSDGQLTAHGGFVWPESGPVEAPDWSPEPECGGGLHGLLWGEGDGGLLRWSDDAAWLVVAVEAGSTVDLGGKVKFPRGEVVFCGDRKAATDFVLAHGAAGKAVVGAAVTAGDYGTATAGGRGTATAGDYGTATAGDRGIIVLKRWDGSRYRLVVGYVGEDGIEPDRAYRLDNAGKFVAAKP